MSHEILVGHWLIPNALRDIQCSENNRHNLHLFIHLSTAGVSKPSHGGSVWAKVFGMTFQSANLFGPREESLIIAQKKKKKSSKTCTHVGPLWLGLPTPDPQQPLHPVEGNDESGFYPERSICVVYM